MAGCGVFALAVPARAAEWRSIDERTHHLRSGAAGSPREWEEFAENAEGPELVLRFDADANVTEHTLRLRQRDVKQSWRIELNGARLGTLVQDENAIVAVYAVPAGVLRGRGNELRVACEAKADAAPDDVAVGRVELTTKPRDEVLSEAMLRIRVTDADGGSRLPCRVTVVDDTGALVTTGSVSDATTAARPGVLYSGNGTVDARLTAGKYTVFAGRGFEYSLASAKVDLAAGESAERKLALRRVVPTGGYVACDPHLHTLTYSRHGDATVDERVITLAGEGIELPVAAEHNLQIDYGAAAEKMAARRYFTSVRGNEVTTPALGHFNVFPIPNGAKLINPRPRDWDALAGSIKSVAPGAVVILNHARDVHGGFAPFDPRRHISVAGENVDGRPPPANAMEVINSGATRADPMELFRDWFGMLNRGHRLAPVGASDSHDVARYVPGQARTYVRYADDANPPGIDVSLAAAAMAEGRVSVSYGLLTQISVDGRFTPGDLATGAPLKADGRGEAAETTVDVSVLGPEWVTATRVALYANGVEIKHADIPRPAAGAAQPAPVKWQGRWTLPHPAHDVHLVAIATGPGVTSPHWPAAKPYQPTTPRWHSYVLGATGAVYLDGDQNGRFDSAYDYATRVTSECANEAGDDADRLVALLSDRLGGFDEAVAAQVASALRARHPKNFEPLCRKLIGTAPPPAARGLTAYLEQWKLTTR